MSSPALSIQLQFQDRQYQVEIQISGNGALKRLLVHISVVLAPKKLLKPAGHLLGEEQCAPGAQKAGQVEGTGTNAGQQQLPALIWRRTTLCVLFERSSVFSAEFKQAFEQGEQVTTQVARAHEQASQITHPREHLAPFIG